MKTDIQVQQDVSDELRWDPTIKGNDIGVVVKDSIVTLTGHVASYAEKWHVERAAQRVAGVSAITLEIKIIMPGSSQRTDVDIAKAIEHALRWSVCAPKDAVRVAVERGYVTLSGEVDWEYQRAAASKLVRYLVGVTGVDNRIALTPAISSAVMRSDIVAALKRNVRNEADNIELTTDAGDVTLDGTVSSWSAKDCARHSAWGAPGVTNVVDNLRVAN